MGAFEEIQYEIEAQLRGAQHLLQNIAQLGSSARHEMESYILWFEQREIQEHIQDTELARKLEVIRAAFAHFVDDVERFALDADLAGCRSVHTLARVTYRDRSNDEQQEREAVAEPRAGMARPVDERLREQLHEKQTTRDVASRIGRLCCGTNQWEVGFADLLSQEWAASVMP